MNKFHLCTARELADKIPDNSVQMVFTDPPYPKEFFHCYEELALFAPKIKEGGTLMTLCGHYQIPDVLDVLRATGLKFHWMCWLYANSTYSRLLGWRVFAGGKPILWFKKKRQRQPCKMVLDTPVSPRRQKKGHKWQQPEIWALEYISKLTREGETVVDPFCGAGTVAAVCKKLGRNFYTCDIDQEALDYSEKRLSKITFGQDIGKEFTKEFLLNSDEN